MQKVKYITKLEKIEQLSPQEKYELAPIADKFVFRSNDYYNSLIDWNDLDDPIRKLVIPRVDELNEWGKLDASGEEDYIVAPGCEHKYSDTALLLCNDVCGAYCRFCFRKRLFMNGNDEVIRDISPGVEYIKKHKEISNILLSGGDPLLMSNRQLRKVLSSLREIDHVNIIRIGTKMPLFNPSRILNDPALLDILSEFSTKDKKIYIMAHVNHPRELTTEAIEAFDLLFKAGCIVMNQTPILRGINDSPIVLSELFNRLSYLGIAPYYLFLCRPTLGNEGFTLPIEEANTIFEEAVSSVSGLAKRTRLSMSHNSGKIEVVGMNDSNIFFKYHRAADPENRSKLLVFRRNPEAEWFDDYEEFEYSSYDEISNF